MTSGGFNLRKWKSNDKEFLKIVPECDQEVKEVSDLNMDNTVKTLGVQWNTASGEFCFKLNANFDKFADTKRELLSQVASHFDPLGWISPILIKPKVLLQSLWQFKLNWDDKIPSTIASDWQCFRRCVGSGVWCGFLFQMLG